MQAGRLLEKIAVYHQMKTVSPYGDEKYDLLLVCNTRAGVDFSSGSRMIMNDELQLTESVTFYVRYYVPVEPYDYIVWDNKKWYITQINWNKPRQEKIVYATIVND